jgi:hypothetical protein
VTPALAAQFMMARTQANPMNIVGFEGDIHADYKYMNDLMEELKKVNAVRISFNNKVESTQPKY